MDYLMLAKPLATELKAQLNSQIKQEPKVTQGAQPWVVGRVLIFIQDSDGTSFRADGLRSFHVGMV